MLLIWEGVEANQEGLGPHWVWYSGGLQMVSGIQPGESGKQLNMVVYTGVWSVHALYIQYVALYAYTVYMHYTIIHLYRCACRNPAPSHGADTQVQNAYKHSGCHKRYNGRQNHPFLIHMIKEIYVTGFNIH